MVASKIDVSKERLKAAVDTADGKPRSIVFTADVKLILEYAAKLEAQLDAARDTVAALLEGRRG